jgi:hypothetical protein
MSDNSYKEILKLKSRRREQATKPINKTSKGLKPFYITQLTLITHFWQRPLEN